MRGAFISSFGQKCADGVNTSCPYSLHMSAGLVLMRQLYGVCGSTLIVPRCCRLTASSSLCCWGTRWYSGDTSPCVEVRQRRWLAENDIIQWSSIVRKRMSSSFRSQFERAEWGRRRTETVCGPLTESHSGLVLTDRTCRRFWRASFTVSYMKQVPPCFAWETERPTYKYSLFSHCVGCFSSGTDVLIFRKVVAGDSLCSDRTNQHLLQSGDILTLCRHNVPRCSVRCCRYGLVPGERVGAASAVGHPAAALPRSGERRDAGEFKTASGGKESLWRPLTYEKYQIFNETCQINAPGFSKVKWWRLPKVNWGYCYTAAEAPIRMLLYHYSLCLCIIITDALMCKQHFTVVSGWGGAEFNN